MREYQENTPPPVDALPDTAIGSVLSIIQRFCAGEWLPALQEAEILIQTGTEHAEVFEIAGLCAKRLGQAPYAEQLWQQALARGIENAGICCNLAILQANNGQLSEAGQLYRQAIGLDPEHQVALCNLGVLLAQSEQDDEAEQCYRRVLAINPDDADTHSNLGALLAKHQQDNQAEQCYRQALDLDAQHASAHSNLGALLVKLGRFREAEQHLRDAVALASGSAQAHTNLGLTLEKQGQLGEAETCHRTALTLNPTSAEIHSNLGVVLAQTPQTHEAEQHYQTAIALAPSNPVYASNLAVLLADLGRCDEAEHVLRQALVQSPDSALLRTHLGQLLLSLGRFEEGWSWHEARYAPGISNQEKLLPDFPYPQWQGETLAGKSLLVWLEQGMGDGIQFCRYLPLLKVRGARWITLVCPAPLCRLMATLGGVDRIIRSDDLTAAGADHDYWVLSLSLPLHCQTTLQTIPAQIPYLSARPADKMRMATTLPQHGLRIGLVWQGNPRHSNDRQRSLPGPELLAPLWSIPGTVFVSLQKSNENEMAAPRPLLQLGAALVDFSDTAAILSHLDLLISVDTAVAHLAGALGVPCWLLLPARNTDWRWLRERSDSPWYPGMRLFRQQTPGDWVAVIERIRHYLSKFAGESASA
ncbi:MAG: tetratricopeptide repeat protein [Formivibrio sp.]|nr:tetratricopeptide repeat protein [Formivibrio sp.]